jgi:hypothetical protein
MNGEGPPGGAWGEAMVGHVWTPHSDLTVTSAASTKRQATAAAWHHFSDELRQKLSGPLHPELQKGMTADAIRETFKWCADQGEEVAETNDTIGKAHGSAHDWATDLNFQLAEIAEDGSSKIKQIQESKEPAPVKLGQIVDVVMEGQQRANAAAAPYTQNLFEAIQTVLDRRGIDKSARQFAQEHGIDTTGMLRSPGRETVTNQVQGILNGPDVPQTLPPADSSAAKFGNNPPPTAPPPEPAPANPLSAAKFGNNPPPTAPPPEPAPANPLSAAKFGNNPPAPPAPNVPASGPLPAPRVPGAPMPAPAAMGSSPGPPVAAGLTPTSLTPSNPITGNLAPGTATPLSALTGTVPQTPVEPQVPPASPVGPQPPVAPTLPSAATIPAFATPQPAHAPVVDTPPAPPPPPVEHTTSFVVPSAPMTPPPVLPPTPAGPLPAYGADIRPPIAAASVPTAPASPQAPATPTSAPLNPSAGAGGVAQPVIRQPAAVPSLQPTPAGVGEQAVVATGGGAAAGAASAQASAQARLQRLVDFVARQEPRLRWSAGDRPDGTTVLVTDLASGWIPPDIDLPSGVELLDPARRRGDIEALLGQVTVTAGYTPLHYLPPNDDEPIATSPRPRQGPVVEELGWELNRATNWRDGLPRLAHTLAVAASKGTGVIDKEVELLRERLGEVREQVMQSYHDGVDADAAVANWQLLAAIDALVASDKTGANYHFAWFQALTRDV